MKSISDLSKKHCISYSGGTKPLTKEEYEKYLSQIKGWNVINEKILEKKFEFKDFKEALSFLNNVGKIAEEENHHPDMQLFGYNKVKISLSTHTIHGLSENDFIISAKIDNIV